MKQYLFGFVQGTVESENEHVQNVVAAMRNVNNALVGSDEGFDALKQQMSDETVQALDSDGAAICELTITGDADKGGNIMLHRVPKSDVDWTKDYFASISYLPVRKEV